MKQKISLLILPILFFTLTSCSDTGFEPVDYVNPYIGNISHLLVPTYPTVHIPNSMVRFYPNRDNFTSNNMHGFPLNVVSHRSGKVWNLSPFSGNMEELQENIFYTYDNEKITPYSYNVTLDEPDINVQFIPAEKSGFFGIRFNNDSPGGIILSTTGNGELVYANNAISGYDTFDGIKAYLYLELDKAPLTIRSLEKDILSESTSVSGSRVALAASFETGNNREVKIRYGLSYISVEQAEKNLQNDIPGWNQDEISDNARTKWNSALSRIEIEGGTENQRTVFYTSLYRCFERMVDITEDGQYYSIWSNKVESSGDTAFYTDDWVWDTHLALHPLQVILNPSEQDEKITSYIRMARQSGWMPTFPTI